MTNSNDDYAARTASHRQEEHRQAQKMRHNSEPIQSYVEVSPMSQKESDEFGIVGLSTLLGIIGGAWLQSSLKILDWGTIGIIMGITTVIGLVVGLLLRRFASIIKKIFYGIFALIFIALILIIVLDL